MGRIAVLAVFVLGALWAPVIGQFRSLWIYLQTVQAYLMMPMAGVFFLGVLWRRTNTAGVLACVATALVVSPAADRRRAGALPAVPGAPAPAAVAARRLRRVPGLHGGAGAVSLATRAAARRPPRHDHARRHAVRSRRTRSRRRGRGLRDYRLWLGLVAGDHDGPLVRDALRQCRHPPPSTELVRHERRGGLVSRPVRFRDSGRSAAAGCRSRRRPRRRCAPPGRP